MAFVDDVQVILYYMTNSNRTRHMTTAIPIKTFTSKEKLTFQLEVKVTNQDRDLSLVFENHLMLKILDIHTYINIINGE